MKADIGRRIAEALERLAPPPPPAPDFAAGDAFLWQASPPGLRPVARVAHLPVTVLQGIAHQRDQLLANTRRFAAGLPANNAILWGARGMGKSSLVKAVHAACPAGSLALVEIAREEIASLPQLLGLLRAAPRRFLLFCDDLSFDRADTAYRALKSVLDGGIEGRPENVLLYATSNRRHLLPREMMEAEAANAVHRGEAADELISLSDRFGLWLGFHACEQSTYLAMVAAHAHRAGLDLPPEALQREAIAWAATRGARSGRIAAQFIDAIAGHPSGTQGRQT